MSFFDWQNKLKGVKDQKNEKNEVDPDSVRMVKKSKDLNSVGIDLTEFKNFLKEWKKKNFF